MKRIVALTLALVMVLGLCAACGKQDEQQTDDNFESYAGAAGTSADNINKSQVVKLLYSDEISDWNPLHPSAAGTWANWIDTLVEYDNYGMCQPCLAESWTKSEDGTVWTFKIREGVQWQRYDGSDYGAETVAEDWVTSVKWILDPANTSRAADKLFDIVGAEDYYMAKERGENPDFETVGYKAISKYELQITLNQPCPYFLSSLTFNWGYPTNAQFLEEMGDKFGTDNTTILYNGAFLCSEWEQNSYQINVKNPEYWDIDKIFVERLEKRYNAEESTLAPEMLLRGEVSYADIPTSQVDEWLADPEKADLIRPNRPGSNSYWYLINFMPTYEEKTVDGYKLDRAQWLAAANNLNFRKALYYGLDRLKAISCYDPHTPENELTRTITPPNFCAADGVDYTELDALKPFSDVDQFQSDKALEYRDAAKAELEAAGVSLPIVAYMPYQLDSTQTDLAVVVSQQMEALLGEDFIKFILEGYPATDYLSTTRRAGNYSFMLSYWGPDYADPETWTEPFALGQAYNYIWHMDGMATQTTEGDPDGRKGRSGFDETWWKDSTYDEKVKAAAEEVVDLSKRYNAFAEVEAWLLDQAVVIPVGTLGGCGYVSSYMNCFESQYAPFGASSSRYKYQYVMAKPMNTEEYLAGLEVWEAERARRISEAQKNGIDY